jgi:hypothetical protein
MATDLEHERELRALIDRLIDDKLTAVLEQLPALVEARLAVVGTPATPIDLTIFAVDVLPPDETPDMLNEAVDRWRHGQRD